MAMKKGKERSVVTKKDIYDMSTRELRKEIRRRTASVNVRIMEYREVVKKGFIKSSKIVEEGIRKLREASSAEKMKRKKVDGKVKTIHTGKYYIPEGKKGEIGLGLGYKTKSELQRQLAGLRRFEEKDIETPEGQREWSDKVDRQYKTFQQRYGNMSKEDYEDMIDTMNIVKNTLKDYGYEDFGAGYARMYNNANKQGKRKFTKYVDQAKRESVGKTTEDVLDRVAELLRENNEI